MNEINIIHEINNKNTYKIPKLINENQKNKMSYDLQNNFFDPNTGSPPNYFISKLLDRIKNYETDKKVVNLNKEY